MQYFQQQMHSFLQWGTLPILSHFAVEIDNKLGRSMETCMTASLSGANFPPAVNIFQWQQAVPGYLGTVHAAEPLSALSVLELGIRPRNFPLHNFKCLSTADDYQETDMLDSMILKVSRLVESMILTQVKDQALWWAVWQDAWFCWAPLLPLFDSQVILPSGEK